jgi:hypothetical protein
MFYKELFTVITFVDIISLMNNNMFREKKSYDGLCLLVYFK